MTSWVLSAALRASDNRGPAAVPTESGVGAIDVFAGATQPRLCGGATFAVHSRNMIQFKKTLSGKLHAIRILNWWLEDYWKERFRQDRTTRRHNYCFSAPTVLSFNFPQKRVPGDCPRRQPESHRLTDRSLCLSAWQSGRDPRHISRNWTGLRPRRRAHRPGQTAGQ